MWNRRFSLCSLSLPTAILPCNSLKEPHSLRVLNVVRNNFFKPLQPVVSEQFEEWLSPQDCDWNIHPKLGWCTRHLWEAVWVPGCGREWISRRGWREQWQMASGLCCITSSAGTCRVSCREPHSQQFLLSSLKKYPFVVDPPLAWRARLGSWLVQVSFLSLALW